jgi:hypothetical protein
MQPVEPHWREALSSCAANTLFGACAWLLRDAVAPWLCLSIEKGENAIRIEVTFSSRWRDFASRLVAER